MKINVAKILPGDALVLPDGSRKTAAGARVLGVGALIEVMWKDGTIPNTFPSDTEIQVVARLHMAVASEVEEEETAERMEAHKAWIMMRPGKDASMTDGYERPGATDVVETPIFSTDEGHFKSELKASLPSPDDHANG